MLAWTLWLLRPVSLNIYKKVISLWERFERTRSCQLCQFCCNWQFYCVCAMCWTNGSWQVDDLCTCWGEPACVWLNVFWKSKNFCSWAIVAWSKIKQKHTKRQVYIKIRKFTMSITVFLSFINRDSEISINCEFTGFLY